MLSGAFNYVRLENLPDQRDRSRRPRHRRVLFRRDRPELQLPAVSRRADGAHQVRRRARRSTVGRMPFSSGGEVVVAASFSLQRSEGRAAAVAADRQFRVVVSTSAASMARASMSIGRTGTSTSRRSCRRKAASKNPPTCRCRRSRSAATLVHAARAATSSGRSLATSYRDRRGEAAVVDNTFSLDRPVDVTIATIGGSYARVLPRRSGEFDLRGVGRGAGRRLVRPRASRRQRGARSRASLDGARRIGRGCAPATCGHPATATARTIATARSSRCCPRRGSTRCRRSMRR